MTATNTIKTTPVTEALEVKPGFKKTRVGWIPEDWGVVTIGDIAQIDQKALNNSTDLKYEFNYISLSDIEAGKLTETLRKVEYSTAPSRARRIVRKNSVLLATVRPNLKSFAIIKTDKKDLIASTGFAVIDVNSKFDSYFLYHFLFSHQMEGQFHALVVGSNYPAINSSDVRRLKVPLPPLPEQQKIAALLSTWDEAIENTQNLITQLKNRKKGLMQQLLTGKTRLPGFEGEWEEVKLGEYFTERKETNQINMPLLSVGKDGVYPQDNSVKKDTSNSDKSKYKKICVGDIGYNTMRMWQGRSALSSLEGIVSPAYTIVTPKSKCNSEYFSYLFKLDEMIHKFYRNSQGMVSDTWMCKFKDFAIVKFMAPNSIEEQKAIAKVLNSADAEITHQENYLAALQAQKKGLMQQLLTGKTRVKLDVV